MTSIFTSPFRMVKTESEDKKQVKEKTKIVLRRRACPIQKNKFPDATKIENELLRHGTTKDKIDTLTLLVERNPSPENYKSLLAFCQDQRNDVHYYALENIRDLLVSKGGVSNPYIKQRIVKSFETNLRNRYIRKKVLNLVFGLLEKKILFVDLIHPFINKLGDKKEIYAHVVQKLYLLAPENEDAILDGLDDFYFKNDAFRSRHAALRFLSRLECKNRAKAFGILNAILEHFDEAMPEEHKNILLEDLIIGLGKNISDERISRIELVRKATQTEKMIFYGSKVLFGTKDPEILSFLRNAIKSNRMRDSKNLPEFLNIVCESIRMHKDRNFYGFLLDFSFLYTPQYITAVLIICSEARKYGADGFDNIHSLRILALHHNDVVRRTAVQLISNEAISAFDPFDAMDFTGAEMMCGDMS